MMLLTHGAFWLNVVVGNANPFDIGQLGAYLANFSLLHCVLLAMAAAECVWMLRRRCWSPWALYAIASSVARPGGNVTKRCGSPKLCTISRFSLRRAATPRLGAAAPPAPSPSPRRAHPAPPCACDKCVPCR